MVYLVYPLKQGKLLMEWILFQMKYLNIQLNQLQLHGDASQKTIKNIKYYCDKENIDIFIYGTIIENSKAIGKNNKAIIGIKDYNLAEAIKKEIHGGEVFGKN